MATLRSAVAIGDTQLLLNAPLAGEFPAYVKVDDEVLPVGGVGATGTVLALSEPAQATHSQGATVTYAGRPYDADFLAATAGEGGGGGAAVDVTFTPNGSIAATDVQAAIQEVRDEAGAGVLLSAIVNLDAADIATLSSVPVQVVAAPGGGKVIVPVSAVFQYKAGAVAFDTDAPIWLRLLDDLVWEHEDSVTLSGLDSELLMASASQSHPIQAEVANQALLVTAGVDPAGSGDGTARLQVLYYVMDLA